jgi:NADH-quinone oxidoreductase subunit A
MFFEYKIIFLILIFCLSLGFLIFFLSYFLIQRSLNFEKLTSYECGFEPFEDARGVFDIKFYLIGILFIIFDLEVIFLFPWILILFELSFFSFFSMIFFLFILIVVYIYEWILGALDW